MERCKICNAYNNKSDKYCHYCGYSLACEKPKNEQERYSQYCRIDNVTREEKKERIFLRRINRIENALVKRNILFDKIKNEKGKVENISLALKNIEIPENKEKIENVKKRIEFLVEELVKCRIDIEFVKFIGNLRIIKGYIANNTIEVKEINRILVEQQEEFDEWESNLKKYYTHNVFLYCEEKEVIFRKLKEEIALKMITGILSTTTLLQSTFEVNSDEAVSDIEKEIERINYEIDRINGELTL